MEIDSTKQPDEKTILDTFGLEYSTLSKTSYDDDNGATMTELQNEAIDFDRVKEEYLKHMEKGPSEMPFSNDALLKIGNTWYFFEFKNATIDIKENVKIFNKIYDSMLIFLETVNKHIDYSRNNIVYVLVFNEESIDKGKISNLFDKNKYKEDKNLFELGCSEIPPSNYRAALFYGLQNMKPNLDSTTAQFGLERFERFIFKKVYTIPKYAFDNFFNRYILNEQIT